MEPDLQDHQNNLQDHQNYTYKEPPKGALLIGRVLMVLEVVLVVLEVVLLVLEVTGPQGSLVKISNTPVSEA